MTNRTEHRVHTVYGTLAGLHGISIRGCRLFQEAVDGQALRTVMEDGVLKIAMTHHHTYFVIEFCPFCGYSIGVIQEESK